MFGVPLEEVPTLLQAFFAENSAGSIALRAGVWFLVAVAIIASMDTGGNKYAENNIRANLGMLTLFLLLGGGLVYLLFGFVPMI